MPLVVSFCDFGNSRDRHKFWETFVCSRCFFFFFTTSALLYEVFDTLHRWSKVCGHQHILLIYDYWLCMTQTTGINLLLLEDLHKIAYLPAEIYFYLATRTSVMPALIWGDNARSTLGVQIPPREIGKKNFYGWICAWGSLIQTVALKS